MLTPPTSEVREKARHHVLASTFGSGDTAQLDFGNRVPDSYRAALRFLALIEATRPN
jgi:hypothetical protein